MANYYYDKYSNAVLYADTPIFISQSDDTNKPYAYPNSGFDAVTNTYAPWGVWVLLQRTPGMKSQSVYNTNTDGTGVFEWFIDGSKPTYQALFKYEHKPSTNTSYNAKGTLIQSNIIAPDGTYTEGVRNADGYWYVKKGLAFPSFKLNVNGALKTSSDGWVNVNGVLKHIEGMWINVNGVLKKI